MKLLVISRILSPGSKKKAFDERDKYFDFEKKDAFGLVDVYRSLSFFAKLEKEIQLLMHNRITKHYGSGRVIAVADAALNTGNNIYFLDDGKQGYVFSQSIRGSSAAFKAYVVDESGYEWNGDEYKRKSRVERREIQVDFDRKDGATRSGRGVEKDKVKTIYSAREVFTLGQPHYALSNMQFYFKLYGYISKCCFNLPNPNKGNIFILFNNVKLMMVGS